MDAASSVGGPSRRDGARVYEEWQGNEVFFCGGRLVAGPNWKSLFGTSLLILIPLVVYTILVGEVLADDIHFAVPLVGILLGALALFFLFTTGCMDPGVLKREEPDDDFLTGRKPKTNEVMVNGHRVLVRYNETCHFYQPPRAHHCSVNDNCIKKFDHHCPWVGTTIGLRNYRFFLSFIFTASVLCIYVCATAVMAIKLEYDNLESDNRDLKEAFEAAPAAVVISGYTALFFLFVGGLSFFHIYLVSTNQTTYENFRYGYDRQHNPYDEGCGRNCWSVWCVPIPKSDVNFRDFIKPKYCAASSTMQTSTIDDESFRDHPRSRGSRSRNDVEMGTYGQTIQFGCGDENSDAQSWSTSSPHTHSARYHAGSRDTSRNVHYLHRPASERAIGPGTDCMEIQVVQPGSSQREEPPHKLRKYHSEKGPEVRMFPTNASSAFRSSTMPNPESSASVRPSSAPKSDVSTTFRPTTVPNQDGVTPRPRATQIPRRPPI